MGSTEHSHSKGMVEEVPVLIVGGSLVGLTLAALLAKFGIKCLVVEKHPSTAIYPKATVMMPRSMQVFEELGLYETMIEESLKYYDERTCIVTVESLAGKLLNTWLEDMNEGIEEVSATRRVFLTQQVLEPMLRSKAKELGAELRFSTTLLEFSQSQDGVAATVQNQDTDEIHQIHCQYMVGCDGFRSATRTKLGIQMSGPGLLSRALTIYFEIVDKEKLAKLPNAHYSGVIYATNEAVRSFFRFDRSKQESFLVINSAGPRGTESSRFPADTVTEAKAAEYLRAAIGDPDIEFKIHSWTTWEAIAAFPDKLQSGRVFLAGDAAHQMPPSGGFGGNTGIQDAHNLAFKLAYVLKHQAGPALLDTYDEERLPIAQCTILNAFAHYLHRTEPGLAPLIRKHNVHEVPEAHLELAYRYHSRAIFSREPLALDDIVESPADAIAGPGSVAHHVLVDSKAGQKGVPIARFLGESFVLFVGGHSESWLQALEQIEEKRGVPVTAIELVFDEDSTFARRYQVRQDGAVLVRPDGFVAWSCDSSDVKSCQDLLLEAFTRALCWE